MDGSYCGSLATLQIPLYIADIKEESARAVLTAAEIVLLLVMLTVLFQYIVSKLNEIYQTQ